MKPSNIFNYNEDAVIYGTASNLDGTHAVVTGIAVDMSPIHIIYIIKKKDGSLWETGYESISITSRCLKKLDSE